MIFCNPLRKLLLTSALGSALFFAVSNPAFAAGGTFSPPSDLAATGTVINSYAAVTSIINRDIYVDSASGFSTGDTALLIQMKGVEVNRADTAEHGDVTDYNSAGRFDFVEIIAVAGNTIMVKDEPGWNFQVSGAVQLIRVEKYFNDSIDETISAMPWDGKKGGVVVIDDKGTLTLNDTIDVSGLGFEGGAVAKELIYNTCADDQINYTGPLEIGTGNKGAGIVVDEPAHRARKGHNANGGGGGNITDAGGGGGGNYGAGGLGGRELDTCDFNEHHGGLGGQNLDYSPMNRVFMGGGGGSGSEISQGSRGGARAGGGIVIIRAKKLVSNGGAIVAKGLSSQNDDGNGADGGGAGGSIALVISHGITGTPEVEVPGGNGGDESDTSYAHGTGGGGGGGAVLLNGPSCTSVHWTAEGGVSGLSMLGADVGDPKWGATDGESGNCLTNFVSLPPVGGTIPGNPKPDPAPTPTPTPTPPPEPTPTPLPTLNIEACKAATPLSTLPDGIETIAFPKGYWLTNYYEGADGVQKNAGATSAVNGDGSPGSKVFRGEAYWGGDGNGVVSMRSQGAAPDNRWSSSETPTSPNLPHPGYSGSVWTSSGDPFYQIDMRQQMTFRGELTFGYGSDESIEDVIEVYVNGLRVYGYIAGGGSPNPRPGAGQGVTIKLEADDQVMVRFINQGDVGRFNVNLSSPRPDCSDSPEDGTTGTGGVINNYGSANHAVDSDIRLGKTVDGESTPINSGNADGDGTDDDGIIFRPLVPGKTSNISVLTHGAGGYLQAWIDWNGDGDFDDAGEQIAKDIQDNAAGDSNPNSGFIDFRAAVPDTVTPDSTIIRFRWSTTPGLASTGPANDGEAEEYRVTASGAPLSCVVGDLAQGVYSTTSVSANSHTLSDETLVYKASFDNRNWEGLLVAYNLTTVDNDGGIMSTVWNTDSTLRRSDDRKLFTYNPTAVFSRGGPLQWYHLNGNQRLAMRAGRSQQVGKDRLAWVWGSQDKEGYGNNSFRERNAILGDVVHANLNLRSRYTNFGYKRLEGIEGSSYADYLQIKRTTADTLLVGANDGLLHGFNADTGKELFAYLPNQIIPKIAKVSHPLYGCVEDNDCMPHEYLVDGRSTVADAYFNNEWHTIMVGTLGLGGKAIYALDVSTPSNFKSKHVLWEISDTQALDSQGIFAQHMGLSLPEPAVVKMKNGRWAAVVANGYESSEHQAVLFIIDIETGNLIKAINTGVGSVSQKNGLSSPAAIDSDGDYIADTIYAGDLQGNLWAFDVSSSDPNDWASKYASSPLFRACMDKACTLSKPITAKPQVGRNPTDGLMVYIGTGRYTDIGDNFNSDQSGVIDTFYGLNDRGSVIDSSKLLEQKILQETDINDDLRSRVTTNNEISYPDHHGWYMNLVTLPDAKDEGERVISKALLREGRLIFTTLAPSKDTCAWDGSSWLMELNAIDGKRLSRIPIDLNDDKVFTEQDNVPFNGSDTIISGVQQPSLGMVFDSPAIISHDVDAEGKYLIGTGGKITMFRESSSRFSGRMSWRQLK